MGTDQDENDYQRQFNAAVSVIQGLPKSGSYRPSYDEMLRFYGYYKQSTAGPCHISRPGFWDPVGRYKWDAWNKLGAMSQEDAMCAYIQEMKMVAQKIINTVPLEETSPEMFEPFRPLYEVIPDMPRPPDSFFTIRTEMETPGDILEQETSEEVLDKKSNSHHSARRAENLELDAHSGKEEPEQQRNPVEEATHPAPRSWKPATDYSNSLKPEEECDRDDSRIYPHLFQASDVTPKKPKVKTRRQSAERRKDNDIVTELNSTTNVWLKNGKSCSDKSSGLQTKCESSPHQLSPQIKATVEALHASIQGLCQRLESLERVLQDSHQNIAVQTQRSRKLPKSQPPVKAQPQTLLFILVWPFIVHWLLRRFLGRKR